MNTVLKVFFTRMHVFQLLTAFVLVSMIAFLFSPGVIFNDQLAYAAQNTAGYGSGQGGIGGSGSNGSGQGGAQSSQTGSGSNEQEAISIPPVSQSVESEGSGQAESGKLSSQQPASAGVGGGGGQPSDTGGGKPSGVGGGSDTHGMPGGEEGEESIGNNLSFPVITADGYLLSELAAEEFSVIYDGPYTGLSEEEKARLEGHDWYAQKTEGNKWQAEFAIYPSGQGLPVFGVDWGDNVEAVNPVIGRPFRLEVTLYHQPAETMTAYTMELLAFPSSMNEVQGTNGVTYENEFATILSAETSLKVQYMGETQLEGLVWTLDGWEYEGDLLPTTALDFGPELNVGGKYIYGASKGGWRPVEPGIYRLTFHTPDSDITFAEAEVGNYADWISTEEPGEEDDEEMHAAIPVIDTENDLTYVDVTVVTRHEGRKPAEPGGGDEDHGDEEVVLTTDSLVLSEGTGSVSLCEPYLTDFLGSDLDNDPIQVVLLQDFLNDTLGTNIILNGEFDAATEAAVRLFQTTYAEDILEPWLAAGHDDVSIYLGTGFVGATTLEKINELMCDR